MGSNRNLPRFRITDHRACRTMMVSLPAQRPAAHADGRRCTWMYETRNETVVQPGLGWLCPDLILPARLRAGCVRLFSCPLPVSVSPTGPATWWTAAAGGWLTNWAGAGLKADVTLRFGPVGKLVTWS